VARGGSIDTTIKTPGWESAIRTMRALPVDVKKEVTRRGRSVIAEPVAREIKAVGSSQGSHAAAVARTVKTSMRNGQPAIRAGGPPYTLGSEFGGRKSKKITYPTTSPLGTRYVVARRTTMQFRVHTGREGYWFYPTVLEGKGRDVMMQGWSELVGVVFAEWARA
jgi:hypothetical protein